MLSLAYRLKQEILALVYIDPDMCIVYVYLMVVTTHQRGQYLVNPPRFNIQDRARMLFSRIEAGPIISTAKSNPQMEYFKGASRLKHSRLLLESFWHNPLLGLSGTCVNDSLVGKVS